MQTNELNDQKVRQLASLRADAASVLSLFLNLDPSEFPTQAARATEVRSLVDEAHRRVRDAENLTHEQRQALKADVERVAQLLGNDLPAKGAHGLAVFCSSALDLFETLRLPRPLETRVVIDDAPHVEPLAELSSAGNWCVLLVNRRTGRMLRGSAESLAELPPVGDDTHGQHDQGGWSQARYERSVEKDVDDHQKRVAEVAFRRFQRSPFDHLLLGGPEELLNAFEERLHSYLRQRLAGRVNVDVESSSPDDVRAAALSTIERVDRERERQTLDRLREAVARDTRGAAGLAGVLEALNERRVETLLLREGFSVSGCSCPTCGWLGALDGGACPADGTPLDCREDIVERAVASAVTQSAEVVVVREDVNEIDSYGSIGALLRF